MANAPLIVTGSTADTPHVGKVLDGLSFFLVQRMPSRSRYVQDIESNGGRVVKLEAQADYVIADHMRKDAPAGSFSYEFIDAALRNGQLPDSSEHAIRPPGSVREVGSTAMGKSTRTPYTLEDDITLWNWVEEAKKQGGKLRGNDLYKDLEAVHPRHTWQSWRDRYVKQLSTRPPPRVTVAANPPPSPPITAAEDAAAARARTFEEFEEDEFDMLMFNVQDIEVIPECNWIEAWTVFAEVHPAHSAEDWIEFYTQCVRPKYLQRLGGGPGSPVPVPKTEAESDHREPEFASKKRKEGVDHTSIAQNGSKRQKRATPDVNDSSNRRTANRSQSREASVALKSEGVTESSQIIQGGGDVAETSTRNPDERFAEPTVTSDLNTAANMQLQQEASVNPTGLPRPSQTDGQHGQHEHTLRSEAELPTSDANRAAEAQFGDWRADHHDENHDDGDHEHSDKAHKRKGQRSDDTRLESPDNSQHALTEANLASQQAQHASPTIRGTDLLEDGEDKDQAAYAKYLQDTLGVAVGDDAQVQSRPSQENSEREDRSAGSRSEGAGSPAPLPLSSPQEVDDVLADGLNWPASPKLLRNQNEERGLMSEFQSSYPDLPSQTGHDYELPTQALMSQLAEATSPNRRGSGSQTHDSGEIVFPDFQDLVNGDDMNVDHGYDESQQESDDEDRYHLGGDSDGGDDVDLTVAEPDGGFGSPGLANENVHQSDAALEENAESQPQSVVVISSNQSSSSPADRSVDTTPGSYRATNVRSKHMVETQDILNAETQLADLEVPWPPESDDEFDDRSPRRSQKQPKDKGKEQAVEAATLDTAEDVISWVSTMVVRGYKQAAAVNALKRTSNRRDLALLVLIEGRAGKGLPDDVRGVWSEAEDEILESGSAPSLSELRRKHGWPELEARLEFLQNWRGLG